MVKHWSQAPRILITVAWVALCGWFAFADFAAEGGDKVDNRVFELRTYYAAPGKMEALHARFRDHTNKLFVKHGMTLIAFWSPIDAKDAQQRMIYVLAYPSKAAADKSWEAFKNDPDWIAAKTASEKDGKLVARVESVFMKATDYSPLK